MERTALEPVSRTRWRAGWAGAAGVAVALGVTELLAGIISGVPSAMAAIGAFIIDVSPGWLESFAISVFGTADKLVLGIGIFVVAIAIGAIVGRRSTDSPIPITLGFVIFGALGYIAQLSEAGAAPVVSAASTLVAIGAGLGTFFAIISLSAPVEDPNTDNDATDIGRRRLFIGIAAAVVVSGVGIGIGRAVLRSRAEAQRSALVLPTPVEIMADPTSAHDFDLPGVSPAVVSNTTFYRIDTALIVPTVDPNEWSMTVHGMVDREVRLDYRELLEMDQVERYVTLSCVSNEIGGRLVGNALWTGVLLRDILDMAGVDDRADQVVGRSVDGFTAGFPTEYAFDRRDAMVAVGMNREVLPTAHGFPARLVVPGLYGYVSATKWLTEIELTTWGAFDGYWIDRGWAKEGPIKTQSRIDRPKHRDSVVAGAFTLGGVAWAPNIGIEQVEVRIDDGPWQVADLAESLSDASWRLWKLDVDLPAGEHHATVRATDRTGTTQTEMVTSPKPDGATGWHRIRFQATEA
ncbi:MAG: molybdopterin-dependent oxidoreductase [Acidimicrobiia bacterium]